MGAKSAVGLVLDSFLKCVVSLVKLKAIQPQRKMKTPKPGVYVPTNGLWVISLLKVVAQHGSNL